MKNAKESDHCMSSVYERVRGLKDQRVPITV